MPSLALPLSAAPIQGTKSASRFVHEQSSFRVRITLNGGPKKESLEEEEIKKIKTACLGSPLLSVILSGAKDLVGGFFVAAKDFISRSFALLKMTSLGD